MKNLFSLTIGIMIFLNVNAQTPMLKWVKTFNGKFASNDSASVTKIYNLDKSIYIAGTSNAYGTGNDIVLIKRDYMSGDTLWTRHYNGTGSADDQTVDMEINQTTGDIYITGISVGINTGYDIVTLKYSASGLFGWAQRWDHPTKHGDDIPKDISVDNSGKIYVSAYTFTGNSGYPTYYEDFLVLVYNSSGSLLDSEKGSLGYSNIAGGYRHSRDFVLGAKVSNNGEVFISGELKYGAYSQVFVYGLKPTNLGAYYTSSCAGSDYVKIFSGSAFNYSNTNYFNAIELDNSNNVYVATVYDTVTGAGVYNKIGIKKIDRYGCLVWEKETGGNIDFMNLKINSIKVDLNGNVYAAGYEKNNSGNFDWLVVKYSSTGVLLWRVTKKGNGNGADLAYDIAFDEYQNPVVVGVTQNSGTNNDITFAKYNKINGSEIYSVNYDSGNGDEKAFNIIINEDQKIIINGIVNSASQSQNIITLEYCIPPSAAGIISGNSSVCQGQNSISYTVPEISNASSYIWTLPLGASGASLTNNIVVNYSNSAVSGIITVKGHNDCYDGETSVLPVVVNTLPSAPTVGTITQPTCIIVTGSIELMGLPQTGTWTINPTGLTGTGSNTILTELIPGSYVYTVTNSYGCISLASENIVINVKPNNPATPIITLTGRVLHSNTLVGNQWYYQDSKINEATNQDYTIEADGVYYTVVTVNTCTSDKSNSINFVSTGLEFSIISNSIKVFPTPFTDKLTIENVGSTQNLNFEIINSLGVVVYKGALHGEKIIQTSSLTPGVYLILLETGKGIVTQKVVKK